MLKCCYHFDIWQAPRQQCCRGSCQMSERSDNFKYKSRGFETLRDLTIRRLIGYWNGAQMGSSGYLRWWSVTVHGLIVLTGPLLACITGREVLGQFWNARICGFQVGIRDTYHTRLLPQTAIIQDFCDVFITTQVAIIFTNTTTYLHAPIKCWCHVHCCAEGAWCGKFLARTIVVNSINTKQSQILLISRCQ